MNVLRYNRNIKECVEKANELSSQRISGLSIVSTNDLKGSYLLLTTNKQRFVNQQALTKLYELINITPVSSESTSVYCIPEIPPIPTGAIKPTVNIFFNFYLTPSEERNAEMLATFNQNIKDELIDKIYVIRTKADTHNIKSDKIVDIITDERPKYITMFDYINKYTSDDDINAIINSDCFFNSNFKYIVYHMKHNECYLLNRLEVVDIDDLSKSSRMVGPIDSQDGWVFKGKVHVDGGDYFMGKPGCDNKICYDINNSSYDIINPLKSNVFLYHYHNDSYRSHMDGVDRLDRPYAFARESSINNKSEILTDFVREIP